MKKQNCKNCKFWNSPHQGMWHPDRYGMCEKIFGEGLEVLCEESVNVIYKVSDPEIVTHKDFGCVHFEEQ